MKAIETHYKGYRFRSRLEARWAVFFDAMGVDWEYEPEGFKLSDGRSYLPDFMVRNQSGQTIWYEIKPSFSGNDGKMQTLRDDYHKTQNDATQGEAPRQSFKVLAQDPYRLIFGDEDDAPGVCPRCGQIGHSIDWEWQDGGQSLFVYCFLCDMDTPSGGDNEPETGVFGISIIPHKGFMTIEGRNNVDRFHRKLLESAQSARKARFEHGEKG